MDKDEKREFYKGLRERIKQLRMEHLFEEPWRIVDDLLCTGDKCSVRTAPYIYMQGNWGPTHKTNFITKWDYPA